MGAFGSLLGTPWGLPDGKTRMPMNKPWRHRVGLGASWKASCQAHERPLRASGFRGVLGLCWRPFGELLGYVGGCPGGYWGVLVADPEQGSFECRWHRHLRVPLAALGCGCCTKRGESLRPRRVCEPLAAYDSCRIQPASARASGLVSCASLWPHTSLSLSRRREPLASSTA